MADRIELQRMYSSVFSHCLNVLSVAADVTDADKLFHIRAAATGKARSQTMERRVDKSRALVGADRSRRRISRVETSCNSLARYDDA